ncbi:beta-amylase 4 [Actinidia rufa]|uniref:Beta-amylase n=1 Tax=Actinidia rufa TaxID=165716 RepID=A0A7J0DY92_9ERIC|nr:beta-amylase 4 [Actinidia rufa]
MWRFLVISLVLLCVPDSGTAQRTNAPAPAPASANPLPPAVSPASPPASSHASPSMSPTSPSPTAKTPEISPASAETPVSTPSTSPTASTPSLSPPATAETPANTPATSPAAPTPVMAPVPTEIPATPAEAPEAFPSTRSQPSPTPASSSPEIAQGEIGDESVVRDPTMAVAENGGESFLNCRFSIEKRKFRKNLENSSPRMGALSAEIGRRWRSQSHSEVSSLRCCSDAFTEDGTCLLYNWWALSSAVDACHALSFALAREERCLAVSDFTQGLLESNRSEANKDAAMISSQLCLTVEVVSQEGLVSVMNATAYWRLWTHMDAREKSRSPLSVSSKQKRVPIFVMTRIDSFGIDTGGALKIRKIKALTISLKALKSAGLKLHVALSFHSNVHLSSGGQGGVRLLLWILEVEVSKPVTSTELMFVAEACILARMEDLKMVAYQEGKPLWGNKGPYNTGCYNSFPSGVPFLKREKIAFFLILVIFPLFALPFSGMWCHTVSHPAELTAGYYNTAIRDGYDPLASMLSRHRTALQISCCEMMDNDTPETYCCSPERLIQQEGIGEGEATICSGKRVEPKHHVLGNGVNHAAPLVGECAPPGQQVPPPCMRPIYDILVIERGCN